MHYITFFLLFAYIINMNEISEQYNIRRLANYVGIAIISQFFADLVFSVLDDNILETDVIVSDVSLYSAATMTALVVFGLPKNIPRLELIIIATISYEYFKSLTNEITGKPANLEPSNIIFTVILVEIISLTFDKKAINDYINKYNQRNNIAAPVLDTSKNSIEFLFYIFLGNLISYPIRRYRESISTKDEKKNTS